jgi:lipoprotein-anchoring transpeptidase ErfK/SrfK
VVGPPNGWIATLEGPLTWSATPGGAAAGTLPADNPFGTPEVLALVGRPQPDGSALAELPVRPDGSRGWIRTQDVTLTVTGYAVSVSLAARTLTVTDNGSVVLTSPVGIGATRTPTPPADTYIWELVRPTDPDGAYGPYIFGLAEFSDALSTFNGGDAQIGIHGTDEPWTIGEAASHGCVHLPNALVARLATILPLGTPVTIS